MPLPEEPAGIRRYVDELAGIGAAALVIELVRRYHRPPEVLVHACRARGLPLITLAKDVNFLEVTQVVHALVLGNQAEAMRRTQRVHEAFTKLTLRGAGPEDVMRAAAEMSGRTVVLENLVHQALICEPSGTTLEEALTDWEQRSRATPPGDRTSQRGPEGWLTAPVEYQGERWGRVAMLPAPTAEPGLRTGARHRPGENGDGSDRRPPHPPHTMGTHRTPQRPSRPRRAAPPLPRRRLRPPGRTGPAHREQPFPHGRGGPPRRRHHSESRDPPVPGPAHDGNPDTHRQTDPRPPGGTARPEPLTPLAPTVERLSHAALDLSPQAVVSVGSEVDDLTDAPRSFHQATRVAEATPPDQPLPPGRSFHELSDVGLRRLLYALREDTRIQQYAEQQLGRLLDHDTRHGTDLLTTLRHYLDAAGNKTSAARRGGLSRETFYQRMRTIERLLDCDLESGEQRTALQVALTALDVLRVR